MLTFQNNGEIDIRAATVAGMSAKETNSPIGYFGTGLKYAIACILRWNGEITIYSGLTCHKFSKSSTLFRQQDFDQVALNGLPIGYTTEYGKNWRPWQVFRELYANALDEGGAVYNKTIPAEAGKTTIHVSCTDVESRYFDKDKIILPPGTEYDLKTGKVEIIYRPSDFIYFRGVRVCNIGLPFTANITDKVILTEDRTLSYYTCVSKLQEAIQQFTNKDLISRILDVKNTLDFSLYTYSAEATTSKEFLEVALRLYKLNRADFHFLTPIIKKHFPEILTPKAIQLSPLRQKMLDKAISLVARMGVEPNCKIAVADLGTNLGQYSNGEIYLSPEVFDLGTKQVLSTLYEELIHHHTGKTDCNYDMQTYLFNLIVSLYEEHVFKEPI